MRAVVITLSVLSAVLIVIVGGTAAAFAGFGFDYAAPYNTPYVVVIVLLFLAPGVIVDLIGLGIALNDASRRRLGGWFAGMLAWPLAPLAVSDLMFAKALTHPELWWLALAFLPLAPLLYALLSPTKATAPASNRPQPATSPRFYGFLGALVVVALGGVALLFPGPQTSNIGSSGPPAIQVSQSADTANCVSGAYPTITLTNSGSQTLQWTAATQDLNVRASPTHGSLSPGAAATVSLNGRTYATNVIVLVEAGGQRTPAKIGCTGN